MPSLGSGGAEKARKALKNRQKQLDEAIGDKRTNEITSSSTTPDRTVYPWQKPMKSKK